MQGNWIYRIKSDSARQKRQKEFTTINIFFFEDSPHRITIFYDFNFRSHQFRPLHFVSGQLMAIQMQIKRDEAMMPLLSHYSHYSSCVSFS